MATAQPPARTSTVCRATDPDPDWRSKASAVLALKRGLRAACDGHTAYRVEARIRVGGEWYLETVHLAASSALHAYVYATTLLDHGLAIYRRVEDHRILSVDGPK